MEGLSSLQKCLLLSFKVAPLIAIVAHFESSLSLLLQPSSFLSDSPLKEFKILGFIPPPQEEQNYRLPRAPSASGGTRTLGAPPFTLPRIAQPPTKSFGTSPIPTSLEHLLVFYQNVQY